jgi:uncharacterized RDD family membrane protein YckC
MEANKDIVSKILSALSHTLRRKILSNLSEKQELSFTDLMNALEVDTGKLSFHIRSLDGFLEQTSSGKYRLSQLGENSVGVIKNIESWAVAENMGKQAQVLPVAELKTRVFASLIDFGISFMAFIVAGIAPGLLPLFISGSVFRLDTNWIFFLLVLWTYLTLFEGFAGQSLGKRILRLRVVRVDGRRLSYDCAAVRNFGKVFLLPFDLYLGHRLKDEKFIRYFDRFAGTTVIRLLC